MFIIILDNKQLIKHNLDSYYKYKGIEIYLKNDRYYINLKDDYYFIDNTKSKQLLLNKYEIKIKDVYYELQLYVYDNDEGIDDFKLYDNVPFIIANNDKANIICKDPYLSDYYLYINEGIIKSNFDICVNNNSYNGDYLCEGDIIDYLGIRVIYFCNYLYINSFNCLNKLSEYNCHETIIQYPIIKQIPNYYIPNKIYELKIDDIAEFKAPKKTNFYEFIKSFINNLIMSISMVGLACVSFINSLNNKQPIYSRITYIIMPLGTLLTGLIIPLIYYLYDKHKYNVDYSCAKNEYLNYLNDYDTKLKDNIKSYIGSYNERYFSLNVFKDKMFYANDNSDEFLNISLGKIVINKKINYKPTGDEEIDNQLKQIERVANYIDDYPLFLNLKDNHIVTIVTKKNQKKYFFNKFLLELAYKHHYDDINIAIYSNDQDVFDDVFNLPHLFINNKRLTLCNNRQLQQLDQMKLNKPLILFVFNYLNYDFTNKNIYLIYLSNDISDLYKHSNCVVEYLNNNAYLYKDGKKEFKYIQEDIDFNLYFNYLGRLHSIKQDVCDKHFRDIFGFDIESNYLNCDNSLICNFAFANNELLNFDLHESKVGPHGLIGGCTGSGKSELIISLLLSLCIKYSPEYLNIVLIDYKGGGIKEALTSDGIGIPHIVASISNLENNILERLIICLNNECKNRQELFKSLSSFSGVCIANLDDYFNNYHKSYGLRKLAHLLIVVDEFAELKKNNPEQIKELISLSRIGRSLGIHLILATQKPNGIIDEEIWSNAHFKIALKVFDEKDSQDLIKCKDAAYLNNAGSFLLKVDDSLIKAQSIYSKSDINDNDNCKVCLLDNTLDIVKSYKTINKDLISECNLYTKLIIDTCNKLNLKTYKLNYLPLLPKTRKQLTMAECLVFGQSDDYINNQNNIVSYKLSDSILIYSSRNKEINSILNTLNEFKRRCVVIANKRFVGAYICDSLLYDEHEDIEYLFNYLLNHKNHNLSLVIEDINCLLSYDESYLDVLCKLCRRSNSIGLGLLFISSNSQLSFKLINYFNNRILIGINDNSVVSSFYNTRCKYKGNSFYYTSEPISMIPLQIEDYFYSDKIVESIVKRIPEIIKPNINNNNYLLGYDIYTKDPIYSNDFLVVSLDKKLLDIYKNAYKNIQVYLYKYNLNVALNKNILWLGPGIFNQRLFIASNSKDLNNNEGIYISNGSKYLLRSIDDA